MKKIWTHLKKKWNKSDAGVALIFVIFAITGFSFLWVKPFVFDLIGFYRVEHVALRVLYYILIMYPLYQIMLLIWGTLFGQFTFFWAFLGKMNRRFGKLFNRK